MEYGKRAFSAKRAAAAFLVAALQIQYCFTASAAISSDLYPSVRDFVSNNLGNESAVRSAMAQYGVSQPDVTAAFRAQSDRMRAVVDFVAQNGSNYDAVISAAVANGATDREVALGYAANGTYGATEALVAQYRKEYLARQAAARNCQAQNAGGYSVPALQNGASARVSRTESVAGGTVSWTATASCSSSSVTVSGASPSVQCQSGYVPGGTSCVPQQRSEPAQQAPAVTADDIRNFVSNNLGNESAVRSAMAQYGVSQPDVTAAFRAQSDRMRAVVDFVAQNGSNYDAVISAAVANGATDREVALGYAANGTYGATEALVAQYRKEYLARQQRQQTSVRTDVAPGVPTPQAPMNPTP